MATAVVISRRRRQQQLSERGLSNEEIAATTLQAAFRGYRVRASGMLREMSDEAGAMVMIPVRMAARVPPCYSLSWRLMESEPPLLLRRRSR